jgi:hypothetical protein
MVQGSRQRGQILILGFVGAVSLYFSLLAGLSSILAVVGAALGISALALATVLIFDYALHAGVSPAADVTPAASWRILLITVVVAGGFAIALVGRATELAVYIIGYSLLGLGAGLIMYRMSRDLARATVLGAPKSG